MTIRVVVDPVVYGWAYDSIQQVLYVNCETFDSLRQAAFYCDSRDVPFEHPILSYLERNL